MKKNRDSRGFTLTVAVLSLALVSLTGCKIERTLSPLRSLFLIKSDDTQVAIDVCTTPAAPIQSNLKYIFILDNSKSNAVNFQAKYTTDPVTGKVTSSPLCPINLIPPPGTGLTTYATDPTRERRYKALADYMTAIEADPVLSTDTTRFYSLVEFSTFPTVQQAFTNNVTQFKTAVNNRFANGVDDGATNYLAALSSVKGMIQADIASERQKPSPKASAYILIHISDGMPLPGGLSCNGTTPIFYDESGEIISGPQSTNEILQLVQSIISFEADPEYVESVTLFTGYLGVKGNEDPGAKELLAQMASLGHGVSYDFTNGESINFALFSLPPRMLRFELGEIFVRNASAVWWPGETEQLLDTDNDGLPDKFEVLPRFDVLRKDTNGNGVSDLVEYLHPTGPAIPANIPVGLDSDGDGLTDREEFYLGNSAGIAKFDTNGNLIPDGLEFMNFLDYRSQPNASNMDSDLDGLSNLFELKHSLPAMTSNAQYIGLSPATYTLDRVSATPTQECYKLSVSGLKRMGNDDLIRVEFIEKSPVIFNQTRLRTAEKRFVSGSSRVDIDMR